MGSEWKAQLLCQTPKAADGSASVCTARTVLQCGARATVHPHAAATAPSISLVSLGGDSLPFVAPRAAFS